MPKTDNISIINSIQMVEENIVEISYKDYAKVTTTGIADVFEVLYSITDNKKVARLVIIGKDNVITNAARLAVANENKQKRDFIIAEAVVVSSFYQKIKVNFYLSLIKKIYPSQCFTDIELAKEWLRKQIRIRI